MQKVKNILFQKSSLYIVLLLGSLSLIPVISHYQNPFREYASWFSHDLSIEAIALQNNQDVEVLLRNKLALPLSEKEQSTLAGLHWIIGFMDDEEQFDDTFSDLIILLNELAHTEDQPHLSEIAAILLEQSLARGQSKLDSLFDANETGRWDYIGILPIIVDLPEFTSHYLSFYQQQFADLPPTAYQSGDFDFKHAVEQNQFVVIGDYLIDTSFLHYYIEKDPHTELSLPPNTFNQHLQSYEKFTYDLELEADSDDFIDLAYLATHVPLVLTNYGEVAYHADHNGRSVNEYINATYEQVRFHTGDLDLLAEYLQSIKILDGSRQQEITETESLLLSLQREDGSWGTNNDFQSDPYIIFHPTWAVLTALSH